MGKKGQTRQKRDRARRRRSINRTATGTVARAAAPPQAVRRTGQDLTQDDLFVLYNAGKYDDLSKGLLLVLRGYNEHFFVELGPDNQERINSLVECLFYLFTKPDYVISPRFQKDFVLFLPLITNLVAMSKFRTTDQVLEVLRDQPNSLPKILSLYSARNRVRIDYERFFDQDAELASLWYSRFFHAAPSCHTQTIYENLRHHLESIDDRHQVKHISAADAMFYCTYIDPESERSVKEKLNAAIRKKLSHVRINNNPNPRSIAIFASAWTPGTAICKGMHPFIEALSKRYDLTLVHLTNRPIDETDKTLFKDVRPVLVDQNGQINVDSIADNDFRLAFHTEVSLSAESRYLSNLRIAPVQVTSYGHPASTWGSKIDYFLGGTELEAPLNPQDNYYERLVLVHGGCVYPAIPEYCPQRQVRGDSEIIVNCVWNGAKCNFRMILILKRILRKIRKKFVFQFLQAMLPLQINAFIAYKRDIQEQLGPQNVRVLATRDDSYREALEMGHFSIDSYPFGSFTGVVDALHVGIPTVTWEGDRAYNRSASRLNRKAGLEELIAHNEDEYVEIICRVIEDDEYRNELYDRIRDLDLKEALFDPKEVDYFVKAIDYLIENHEELQRDTSREPILISP